MTTPWRSLPIPKRISAMPAASASLTIVTGRPVALRSRSTTGKPIQVGSMLEAVIRVPSMVTPGRPTPTGVVGPSLAALARRFVDPADRGDHRLRRGGVGGRDADPLGPEPAGFDVDHGRLDSAAADIDADGDPTARHLRTFVRHRVRLTCGQK